MAFFDDERNILSFFYSCTDDKIYLLSNECEKILKCIRNLDDWICSSGKSDPPPDFYSDKYNLMMDVMRVDDHAFKDDDKIKNPHIQKENKVYKEVRKFLENNNISYSGDIFVNTVTDLPTREDHSYEKYIENFKRVLKKHNKSSKLYFENHPNHELIYFILDESSPYMKKKNFEVEKYNVGDVIQAEVHIYFYDKEFISILNESKADYYVWYAPFKHFNSFENFELPEAVLFKKEDLKKIETREYEYEDMHSGEK